MFRDGANFIVISLHRAVHDQWSWASQYHGFAPQLHMGYNDVRVACFSRVELETIFTLYLTSLQFTHRISDNKLSFLDITHHATRYWWSHQHFYSLRNLRSGVFFYYFFFFCFFASLPQGEKITPSSRERHKGIIGRGHDLRLFSTRKPTTTLLSVLTPWSLQKRSPSQSTLATSPSLFWRLRFPGKG